MKTIFLNRHAKSSWADSSLKDYDRPLNERGKIDAPIMAKRLAEREKSIDLFVSSSAKRAFSTAKKIAKAFGVKKKKIIQEKKIYHASIPTLIKIINKFDDDHDRIIIFGHNTTFSDIVHYFTGEFTFMATCAVVRIDFDVDSWKEISNNNGKLIYVDFPKNTTSISLE